MRTALRPRYIGFTKHKPRLHGISEKDRHLAKAGVLQRRQRLGGMLNYYYRAAA